MNPSQMYHAELTDELLVDIIEFAREDAAGLSCDDLAWATVDFLEELRERRKADPAPEGTT